MLNNSATRREEDIIGQDPEALLLWHAPEVSVTELLKWNRISRH